VYFVAEVVGGESVEKNINLRHKKEQGIEDNDELDNLYFSPNFLVTQPRRIQCTEHFSRIFAI
jgi:hypothetical protein